MGILTNGTSGEIAFSSTPKSVAQYKSAANQRGKLHTLQIMGKQPAGGADTPVKVRATSNAANFGTFSGGVYAKEDRSNPETVTATWGGTASAEPTSPTDMGIYFEVQPQLGIIKEFDPPITIPGGTSIQWEITASGSETPTLTISGRYEE